MPELESRVAALERRLGELEAEREIRSLLSQYAIGVDEKRPHLLRALFTEDAVVRVPAWSIEVSGLDALMGFFEHYWNGFDNPRRYYANEDIRVDGEQASAFMYWHVTQERDGDSVLGWGTYDWAFRLTPDGWRIAGETVHIRAMTTLAAGWAGLDAPMQP